MMNNHGMCGEDCSQKINWNLHVKTDYLITSLCENVTHKKT